MCGLDQASSRFKFRKCHWLCRCWVLCGRCSQILFHLILTSWNTSLRFYELNFKRQGRILETPPIPRSARELDSLMAGQFACPDMSIWIFFLFFSLVLLSGSQILVGCKHRSTFVVFYGWSKWFSRVILTACDFFFLPAIANSGTQLHG